MRHFRKGQPDQRQGSTRALENSKRPMTDQAIQRRHRSICSLGILMCGGCGYGRLVCFIRNPGLRYPPRQGFLPSRPLSPFHRLLKGIGSGWVITWSWTPEHTRRRSWEMIYRVPTAIWTPVGKSAPGRMRGFPMRTLNIGPVRARKFLWRSGSTNALNAVWMGKPCRPTARRWRRFKRICHGSRKTFRLRPISRGWDFHLWLWLENRTNNMDSACLQTLARAVMALMAKAPWSLHRSGAPGLSILPQDSHGWVRPPDSSRRRCRIPGLER